MFLPATNNLTEENLKHRAKKARAAHEIWRTYSIPSRADVLRQFWRELMLRRGELIGAIHADTGKPLAEIETMEIAGVEILLKHFTRNAPRLLKDQAVEKPWIFFNKRAFIRYIPRGVIAIICPWNLPFLIPMGDALAAVLAGNAVLVKPSEWTVKTAEFIQQRVDASGLFPDGLIQFIAGDGETGRLLMDRADMTVFTGSISTGREVARRAAEQLKPVVLELGGNHPMIVLEDAALDRAAKAAVWGCFANCGQLCVGVERVFVEKPIYDEFLERVLSETRRLRQGTALSHETDIGRLIFPGQLAVVLRHLADAKEKGGRVFGGKVLDEENLLIEPAVIADATPEMLAVREETFGPVMAIVPVTSYQEAIRLSNAGPYGLAASLWTVDLEKAERISSYIEAGLIGVNELLSHYVVGALPFGGFKQSGLGRRHGDEGLRMFCQPQSVLIHEWPRKAPDLWWFPYSRFKSRLSGWLSGLV